MAWTRTEPVRPSLGEPIHGRSILALVESWLTFAFHYCRNERDQQLAAIVNKLGAASAKVGEVYLACASDEHLSRKRLSPSSQAQGLRVAVTTYQKLVASSHTLYLLRDTGWVSLRRTYTSRAINVHVCS